MSLPASAGPEQTPWPMVPLHCAGFAARLDPHLLRRASYLFLTARQVPAVRADDAVLVLNELLSNACVHSQHPACDWVELLVDVHTSGAVQIEVSDSNPNPPQLRPPSLDAEQGRGLRIVEALADAWGFDYPSPWRKRVHARLGIISPES
jgi:anti-sigma regulatory factor (Ser/Thr protein kinase)